MKHVCRICLKDITDINVLVLNISKLPQIKMKLSFCVPEMVVDLVKDPVFCKSCVSDLNSAYNFKVLCLRTQAHIKNLKSSKSIDIKDFNDSQQSTNVECEANGDKSTRKEGCAVTAKINLSSVKNLPSGQNFNTCQDPSTMLIHAANNLTSGLLNKSAIQTTADELNSLLDDALRNTSNETLIYKQKSENIYKDITKEDEDNLLPNVESASSNEGFEDNLFEDAESEDRATDNEMDKENDSSSVQTNIVIQNCFVKLTRLSEGIISNEVNSVQKGSLMVLKEKVNKFDKYGKSASYLANHSVVHNTVKTFSCTLCKYTTEVECDLKKHELIHEGFYCASCKFHTLQKKRLIEHVQTHTGEKPFACNVCTFRSVYVSNLKQHLRIHKKPFGCNLCNFRSASQSFLQKHLQIHISDKTFACNGCTFRSVHKVSLKRHLRIHTGEKPYSCNVCALRFAQKYDLKRHLRIHTGEKPHFCNVCTSRFTLKTGLQRHLQIHTREKA